MGFDSVWASDHVFNVSDVYERKIGPWLPDLPDNCSKTALKKRPSEYLKQLYFDSLVFTTEALRHLLAECGASQIVMGTDPPYPWVSATVDHILQTPQVSDTERLAILGGTASILLRLVSYISAGASVTLALDSWWPLTYSRTLYERCRA